MQTLPPAFNALVPYQQWILYKLVPRSEGKTDKLPVDWRTGQLPARGAGGSAIWTSFESAAIAAAQYGVGYGVGFSFDVSDPFWFIDLDKALVPATESVPAHWAQWALDVVNALSGCAIEVSQSGKGLHLIGSGTIPPHACKSPDNTALEMYHTGRFVALTGYHAAGDAGLDCTQALAAVVQRWFPQAISVSRVIDHSDREVTDETIDELRDALKSLSADDRHQWVSIGIALSSLGERGYDLWAEWSATSPKHDPSRDLEEWDTFRPDRTGFAAVFAKAQAVGWVNPRAHVPLDPAEVLGHFTPLPADETARPVPVAVRELQERSDSGIATLADQIKLFHGCVHVIKGSRVLTPEGELLDKTEFHNAYGKFSFVKTRDGSKMEQNAWVAFVNSQALTIPQVWGTCFRPELAPGEIIVESERLLVNTFWPIRTACIEGDVQPMIEHIAKLLPYGRDAALFTSYQAAMIQYPGKKIPWCPVIQGTKGNGKSFLGRVMQAIIGHTRTHYPNSQDITNKFTGWLDGMLLIILEELSAHEKRESLEMLKPLITNPYVEMQKKGRDQITGENRANFLIFVNRKNAVPIDDDERRYAAFFTAQQSAEDIKRDGMDGSYFSRLFEWAESGGFAAWHYYLKHYSIPDEMNPVTTLHRAPLTSSTGDSISASLGTVELEVMDAIEQQRDGFCGGWIAHTSLNTLLRDCRLERAMPRGQRTEMLRRLGYVKHPGLHDGRLNSTVGAYGRPTLYITKVHADMALTNSSEIAKRFVAAQAKPGGLVTVYGGTQQSN